MKRLAALLLSLFLLILLCSCGIITLHEHEWIDANCTIAKICASCGATDGQPLGHDWKPATCTSPKTCLRCGAVDGKETEHTWIPETCVEPKTCNVCGKTDPLSIPSGHKWEEATYTFPQTCSVCGAQEGDPLPVPEDKNAYSRGRYGTIQYVGMTGYVAISYNAYLYASTDSPYENDWFSSSWKATTYEKDKQFWNAVGTVAHKTPVIVLEQELERGTPGTNRYKGYLLVEKLDDGSQFYISVIDFVTSPYWESDNINDILNVGPCLAVYHQVSDYYPIDGQDKKADIPDGTIVLVRGAASGGRGFGDTKTNPIDTLTNDGRYYFNAEDLSIVY